MNRPPTFKPKSTHGVIRLSDYTNKEMGLTVFPSSRFTPVCTTEFVEFGPQSFRVLKNATFSSSASPIDSVYSHIAWARNIEQNFDVKIDFSGLRRPGPESAAATAGA